MDSVQRAKIYWGPSYHPGPKQYGTLSSTGTSNDGHFVIFSI